MEGLACPHCGEEDYKFFTYRRSVITGSIIAYRYMCMNCRKTWSVKVTALDMRAEELGIKVENVTKVKHWQTAKGEPRISITEVPGNPESDDIFKGFQRVLDRFKKVDIIKRPITDRKYEADFLLVTTDRHIGMKVDKLALYSGPYGEQEIDTQNLHMIDSVIEEVKLRGRFKDFWYADLGDSVHGYNNKTVRGGHELNSSLSTIEQFELYVSNMTALIKILYEYDIAERMHVLFMVNDNHAGDFGYMCARAAQMVLQQYTDIDIHVEPKFVTHREIGGATYIFTHGKDKEHMKFGMPVVLKPKTETLIDKYMMFNNLPTGNTHVLKGDIHEPATTYGKSFRYKNVIPSAGKSEREDILYGSTWRGYEYEIIEKGQILLTRTVIL